MHLARVKRASVIMVDIDFHSSATEILAFREPLTGRHAVIIVDEWKDRELAVRNQVERLAFEGNLARDPAITAVPSGGAPVNVPALAAAGLSDA